MVTTIKEIKQHLNIDDDFVADDNYIQYLIDVAEKVVEKHIDHNLEKIVSDSGGALPPPLKHAIFLYVGDMYRNRESVSFSSASEIPFSYEYILSLYKNYSTENNS